MIVKRHIELTSRAVKDLRALDRPARTQLATALEHGLAARPAPENLEVKALRGAAPWLRLRVGHYRVLYRPLRATEIAPLVAHIDASDRPTEGYLVERIVNRRDLDRAVASL